MTARDVKHSAPGDATTTLATLEWPHSATSGAVQHGGQLLQDHSGERGEFMGVLRKGRNDGEI